MPPNRGITPIVLASSLALACVGGFQRPGGAPPPVPPLATSTAATQIGTRLADEAAAALAAGDSRACINKSLQAAEALGDDRGQVRASNRLVEAECRLRAGQAAASLRAFSRTWAELDRGLARSFASRRARDVVLHRLRRSEVASLVGRVGGAPAKAWLAYRMALMAEARGDVAGARRRLDEAAPHLEAIGEAERLAGLRRRLAGARRSAADSLGALIPLSGPLRRVGRRALRGLLLASGSLGGDSPGLTVLIRDSGGGAESLSRDIAELAGDPRVGAVLGPLDRSAAKVAAARANTLGLPIVMLSVDSEVTKGGPFVFRNFSDVAKEARVTARYAVLEAGLTDVAILHPNHGYGQGMRDLFREAVQEAGGRVVNVVAYAPTAVTYDGALDKLARGPAFGALFIPDAHARVALLAPHLAAAGFLSTRGGRLPDSTPQASGDAERPPDRPVQILGTSAWYDPALLAQGRSRYLQGAVLPVPFLAESGEPEVIRLTNRSLAAGRGLPGVIEAFSYDTLLLLATALQDPGAHDRDALARSLARLSGRRGVTANTGFGPDRNAIGDPILAVVGEGGFSRGP